MKASALLSIVKLWMCISFQMSKQLQTILKIYINYAFAACDANVI